MNKEDVEHMCSRTLLSQKEKNEIVPFAEIWMDLETAVQNEVRQKGQNK